MKLTGYSQTPKRPSSYRSNGCKRRIGRHALIRASCVGGPAATTSSPRREELNVLARFSTEGSSGSYHNVGRGIRPWAWSFTLVGVWGRLPPPRAVSKGAEGTGDEFPKPDLSNEGRWQFPLKAGLTSGGLALVGDTAAQFVSRYKRSKSLEHSSDVVEKKSALSDETFWEHDWVRAVRMASYGFLCYGPLSHGWYQLLDHVMPVKNFANFLIKVTLNQIVLGPIVVSIVFAWNALWTNRLGELPYQYRCLALPTLIDGWKFWTPVTFLNFGVVPLEARVAFMSSCAVFWNFYLSTAVSKKVT